MAHLLIADDVTISRETLARVLRDAGHRLTAAASGQEAVERGRAECPDLAILDLNMPRMSGRDAAAALKAAHPEQLLPVLIVSGKILSTAELCDLFTVADDFLRKPYLPAELCARVDVWLRTRRLYEEARRGRSSASLRAPQPDAEEGAGRVRTRAEILERLREEWRRAMRWNEPFALLLCDVFDPGPAPAPASAPASAGAPRDEALLSGLARVALRVLRQVDILGQAGPARIAILLPNTPPAGALCAAERVRTAFQSGRDRVGGAALALGLALVPGRDVGGPEDLYRAAETALAQARDAGPFSLCLHQHMGYLVRSP